jgi:hypothetical protein
MKVLVQKCVREVCVSSVVLKCVGLCGIQVCVCARVRACVCGDVCDVCVCARALHTESQIHTHTHGVYMMHPNWHVL